MIVALDLDRTLIHAAASAPAGMDLVVVEELNGAPLSVMTSAAAGLYALLCHHATVVPATTRSLSQYRRVVLPVAPRWAIAANGGQVLRDGQVDAAWQVALGGRIDVSRLPEAQLVLDSAALRTGGAVARVTARDGLFVSAVLSAPVAPAELLRVRGRLAAVGWRLASSGRKVYALPAGLDKEAALAWISGATGEPVVAAAGDSPLDEGMLRLAAAALCPRDSELAAVPGSPGWRTPRGGPAATEDLLARTLEIVAAVTAPPVLGAFPDTSPAPAADHAGRLEN